MPTHRVRDYAGKQYTQGAGLVYLISTTHTYPAWVTDLVDERVRIHEQDQLPMKADFLVHRSALTTTKERAAAKLQAMNVVLPEGADWLREKIAGRTAAGINVVIVVYRQQDIY